MRHVSLPLEQLPAWANLNNVELHNAKVSSSIIDVHGNDKGGGLIATSQPAPGEPVLKVPADLVLSREGVEQWAKTDHRLRELLEVTFSFTQVGSTRTCLKPRLLILVFLLHQMTLSSPDAQALSGAAPGPLTDYVKFLPKEIPLPTFYTPGERELLVGTSLADALSQKLAALEKEFDRLRESTKSIPWCQKLWWDQATGIVSFDDWKLADAMYRSRALELPKGVGDAMVPVVDMANHSYDYNARFEVDSDGNTLLIIRDDKSIMDEQEITIIYGYGGACEMIFSYGFLEDSATSAREVFLDLSIPEDDPLRVAKIQFADEAPGVRLFIDEMGQLQWDSQYVWWACVNEEDGLDFTVLQSTDGRRELKALWKGQGFEAHTLKVLLLADELRDIFVLRATVLITERVERQGMLLAESDDLFKQARSWTNVREQTWKLVSKLRELELDLVTTAYETLEKQKAKLLETDTVLRYFESAAGPAAEGEVEEDFS